ncbi:MAG: nucleotidyltransferase domain-containing protein [Chitinophagaceae bacterium]
MNVESSILKVILYFDIFNYPLSKDEIGLFLDQQADESHFSAALQNLLDDKYLFQHDEFYSVQDKYSLVENRRSGNIKALSLMPTAYKISNLLFKFPFVRGIGISGSLSKNVAHEEADIDFFIITKANRLWIARTLLHMLKKLSFLVGRQHWFCMNYFVDEENLQVEEKNIFTAIELVTLLPVCGNGSLHNFFDANEWVNFYYPNHGWKTSYIKKSSSSSWFKKIVERIFNNSLGDRLDDYFLKLTSRRWNKKEKLVKLNGKGNPMGLKNAKHYSKPNPVFFQEKILKMYQEKLDTVTMRSVSMMEESHKN